MPILPDPSGDGPEETLVGPASSRGGPVPAGPEMEFPRTLLPEEAFRPAASPETLVPGADRPLTPDDGPPAYALVRELGRGAMGVVYLARHRQLGRLVALKMVLGGNYACAEDLARFHTEATAIARLAHPGIVTIYDIGEHRGLPFFAMEYCTGGSLASQLDGSPLPALQATRLLLPIARAMEHAHERGIIHRDLKPGNVLLQLSERELSGIRPVPARAETAQAPRGTAIDVGPHASISLRDAPSPPQPKIADFGLARLAEGGSQTQSGDILGTPSYMAPEQAEGAIRDIGPHTDVWALGAILYEMLTGRPPFLGTSSIETLQLVLFRDPVAVRSLRPEVPRDLETICHKCLQKDPERRYPTAGALADDLDRFLEGRPILARPVSLFEQALRWARRRPSIAALIGLVIVSVAAGIGGWATFTAQLGRQRNEALELKRQAEDNAALAHRNFARALEAVDRSFTEASESALLHEPGATELRKKLLGHAREFYVRFVLERGDDPAVQRELITSQYRLGVIEREVGELAAAVRLFDEALTRIGQLEAPGRDLRQIEAKVLHQRGLALRDLSRLDDALQSSDRALAAWRKLRDAGPTDRSAKDGEAAALMGRGSIEFKRGRYEAARDRYRESLALRRELADAEPANEPYQRDLATNWHNLAAACAQAGQAAEAAKADAEARKALEALVKRFPGRPSYQERLGMSLNTRGLQLLVAGDPGGAIKTYFEAIELFTLLARFNPAVPRYQVWLAEVHWNVAAAYERAGYPEHAGPMYERELAINDRLAKEHPAVPAYQWALARSATRAGDWLAAQGKLDEARKSYDRAGRVLADLAKKPTGQPRYPTLRAELAHQVAALDSRAGKYAQAQRGFTDALALLGAESALRGADQELHARCCTSLGLATHRAGQPEKALAWFDRAAATAARMEKESALVGLANQAARLAARGKALALDALDKHEDALRCFDEAIKRENQAGLALVQALRWCTLARTARYQEAVKGATDAAPKAGTGEVLFELARVAARAAGTASKDQALTAEERTRRESAHLTAALALLRQAHAKGAFATAEGRRRLADEPDLAVLRARPEVKPWLGQALP